MGTSPIQPVKPWAAVVRRAAGGDACGPRPPEPEKQWAVSPSGTAGRVITWTTVENAVQAWFAAASGVPSASVRWANQKVPRPSRPYAELKRISVSDEGTFDELRLSFDGAQPAGQEIGVTTYGPRRVLVSCQVFSDVVTGAGTASEYVELARSALSLPSVLSALRAGGLSLVNRGGTRDLSALVETASESRAQLDVTFSVADCATDRTGYFDTVVVTRLNGD